MFVEFAFLADVQCVQKCVSDCLDFVIYEVFDVNFSAKNVFFKIAFLAEITSK